MWKAISDVVHEETTIIEGSPGDNTYAYEIQRDLHSASGSPNITLKLEMVFGGTGLDANKMECIWAKGYLERQFHVIRVYNPFGSGSIIESSVSERFANVRYYAPDNIINETSIGYIGRSDFMLGGANLINPDMIETVCYTSVDSGIITLGIGIENHLNYSEYEDHPACGIPNPDIFTAADYLDICARIKISVVEVPQHQHQIIK
jgi:hypothetical protein